MSSESLIADLNKIWKDDGKMDVTKAETLIGQIKVALFLGKHTEKELFQMQDIYEKEVLVCIHKHDLQGFKKAISQLVNFYSQNKSKVRASPRQNQILGLNLMYLISTGQKCEFHVELERLCVGKQERDVYIEWPHKLEQYLMEGAYNNIFVSTKNPPSPYYNYFIQLLVVSVREEISECMKSTYKTLTFKDAAKILFFDSDQQVIQFAKEKGWRTSANNSEFVFGAVTSQREKQQQPFGEYAPKLAHQLIDYAKQLEMIV